MTVKRAQECKQRETLDPLVWSVASFVGNLPNLPLSSLAFHRATPELGRPLLYFGQRYQQNELEHIPLAVNFDHANVAPFLINQLLADFKQDLISF